MATTSDAIARETAWLTTVGDGLPALLSPTGPWAIVQAYDPRVIAMKKTTVFVLRQSFHIERIGNVRSRATYQMHLKMIWPVLSGTGSAESEWVNFDSAVDLLLQRVLGVPPGLNGSPAGDKTHGGRFLSAAEKEEGVTISFEDPDITFAQSGNFQASMTYAIDDLDFIS